MAVSVHNASGGTVGSGASALTWDHVLHADADYALVGVRNSANASVTPTGVTLGGEAMQFAFEYQDPDVTQDRCYVYWMPAADLPAPGTQAVVVSWASPTTDGVSGLAVCASGVAQEAPVGIVAAGARGITDVNASITTVEANQRIVQFLLLRSAVSVTPDSGQSTLYTGRSHALTRTGPSTPGAQAMDLTLSGTSTYGASILVPLIAASEGGGGSEIAADQSFGGAATLAVSATVRRTAGIAFAAAATANASATVRQAAASAFAGAATLEATACVRRASSATFTGTATFDASSGAVTSALAAFATGCSFSAVARVRRVAAMGFGGVATFGAAVTLRRGAGAGLSGAATWTASAHVRRAGAVAFSARVQWSARVIVPAVVSVDVRRVASLILPGHVASLAVASAPASLVPTFAPATLVE